jgi:hypothetical protein
LTYVVFGLHIRCRSSSRIRARACPSSSSLRLHTLWSTQLLRLRILVCVCVCVCVYMCMCGVCVCVCVSLNELVGSVCGLLTDCPLPTSFEALAALGAFPGPVFCCLYNHPSSSMRSSNMDIIISCQMRSYCIEYISTERAGSAGIGFSHDKTTCG